MPNNILHSSSPLTWPLRSLSGPLSCLGGYARYMHTLRYLYAQASSASVRGGPNEPRIVYALEVYQSRVSLLCPPAFVMRL